MRYTVYTDGCEPQTFMTLHEAAAVAVDDPEGSRISVYDSSEQRWISGAEIIYAYVLRRKRKYAI